MKKILALALVLVMILSMATVAGAADLIQDELTAANDSLDVPIKGQLTSDGAFEDMTVISVDVEYGAMQFWYVAEEGTLVWNPGTHAYDDALAKGEWQADSGTNTVKVINHSNTAIDVDFAAASTLAGVTAKYDITDGDVNLETAVGTAFADAPFVSIDVDLENDPTNVNDLKDNDWTEIGTLTVKISQPTSTNP